MYSWMVNSGETSCNLGRNTFRFYPLTIHNKKVIKCVTAIPIGVNGKMGKGADYVLPH